jgi:hypothetical protein
VAALALFAALLAPTPAAAAPPRAAAMMVAQLHLLDLECLDENDEGWWTSDEPYINVNGQRVWSAGNVDRYEVLLVNLRFDFDEMVTVELWEDDGGLTGKDDLMGRWFIFAGEVGSGVHKVRSQYSFGTYNLRYEVV